MKILWEDTDENHPITVNKLINSLKAYGISAERKSIYSDIELLRDFGLDILCVREKANKYFIASRDFELPELKLLVDAIQSSRFITYKKSEEFIKKIEKLCSNYEAKTLNRQVVVRDRIKTMNESIYYNVDVIHRAVHENKQIKFQYFDYTVHKKIKYRRDGEYYVVSPYALSWSDEHYYLIAYYQRYDSISNFRVDRMKNIQIMDKTRVVTQEAKNFNVADYSNKMFKMYSGEMQNVALKFHHSLINVVIDRFGKDIFIHNIGKDYFCINVDVIATDTFLGWLFMFGNKVEILAPENLREKMKEKAKNIVEFY